MPKSTAELLGRTAREEEEEEKKVGATSTAALLGRTADSTPAQRGAQTRAKRSLDRFVSGEKDVLPGHAELKADVLPELVEPYDPRIFEMATIGRGKQDVVDMVGGIGDLMAMGFKGLAYDPVAERVDVLKKVPERLGSEPGGADVLKATAQTIYDMMNVKKTGARVAEGVSEFGRELPGAVWEDLSQWKDPRRRIAEHPVYALMDIAALMGLPMGVARSALKIGSVARSAKLAPTLEKVAKFRYRKPPVKGSEAAEKIIFGKGAKKRRRLHLFAMDNIAGEIKKIFGPLSNEEKSKFFRVTQGEILPFIEEGGKRVRNPAVSDNLFNSVEEYRKVITAEREWLNRNGLLTPEAAERIDWLRMVHNKAEAKGLLKEKRIGKGGKRKTIHKTVDDLDEGTIASLMEEVQVEAGWKRPKTVREAEEVVVGTKEAVVSERVVGKTRQATPEELAEHGVLSSEVATLKMHRSQIVDDFIDREYGALFEDVENLPQHFHDFGLPGSLSGRGLTSKDIQQALKTKKGKTYELIQDAALEELTEGYYTTMRGKTHHVTDNVDPMLKEMHDKITDMERQAALIKEGQITEQITEKITKKVPVTETRWVEKTLLEQDPEGWKPIYYPFKYEEFSDPLKRAKFYQQSGMPKKEFARFLRKRKHADGFTVDDPKRVVEIYNEHRAEMMRLEDATEFKNALEKRFAKPYDGKNLEGPDWIEWHWENILLHAQAQLNVNKIFMQHIGEKLGKGAAAGEKAFRKLITTSEMDDALKNAMRQGLNDPKIKKALVGFTNPNRLQVPKWVSDKLGSYVKPPNAYKYLFLDIPTHAWKWTVLKLAPRWTYNDFFGNAMFNTIAGVGLDDYGRLLSKNWREVIPWEQVGESFVQSATRLRHPGSALEHKIVGPALRGASAAAKSPVTLPARIVFYPIKWAANFNGWVNMKVNQTMRAANYLHAARKIATKEVNQRAMKEALTSRARSEAVFTELKRMREDLKLTTPEMSAEAIDYFAEPVAQQAIDHVNYFLNDWMTGLSKSERRIFVTAWPFWSWIKHVVTLSGRLARDFPGRVEMIRLTSLAANEVAAEEGKEFLPDWQEGTYKLREWTEGGVTKQKRVRTTTVNPLHTLIEAGEFLGSTHPLIKETLSAAQGKDVWTGRPLTKPSDPQAPHAPDIFGGYTQLNPRTGKVETKKKAVDFHEVFLPRLAKSFPPVKWADWAVAGGRTYDTSLPLPGMSQPILDKETGKPAYPIDWMDELVRLFGPSIVEIEKPEEMKERKRETVKRGTSRIFNQLTKEDQEKLEQARRSLSNQRRTGQFQNPTP